MGQFTITFLCMHVEQLMDICTLFFLYNVFAFYLTIIVFIKVVRVSLSEPLQYSNAHLVLVNMLTEKFLC